MTNSVNGTTANVAFIRDGPKEVDVEATIASLSIQDKVKLLAGKDFWHFADVPAAGIGSVRTSDGANGVRGTQFFNNVPSSCFPCATGIGSSFDLPLAYEIGRALSAECKAKNVHVLLGPTVNTLRNPLAGRGFESFSEDPFVNGMMAAEYIRGIQSEGVAACLKHFVCNDQEHERMSSDSVVTMRALREIYLEPFRLALKQSPPLALMTSYNRLNGTHTSENSFLLSDILRKEWGWDGLVVSDWTGVVSTVESMKAGLDVEMPGPGVFRGETVLRCLSGGKLEVEDVDDRVRNVLKLHNHAVRSGIPFNGAEGYRDTPELRALLRKAASSSIVLLKNAPVGSSSTPLLPLRAERGRKIAVIGPNAAFAQVSGGGSAAVFASWSVSPLVAIREVAQEAGATVGYAVGAQTFRYVPSAELDSCICVPGTSTPGIRMQFWKDGRGGEWSHEEGGFFDQCGEIEEAEEYETTTKSANFLMIDGLPFDKISQTPFIRMTMTFTPTSSGPWLFGLASVGEVNLYLDGRLLIENNRAYTPGEILFGLGSSELRVIAPKLEEGRQYALELRMHVSQEKMVPGPFTCAGGLQMGATRWAEEGVVIAEAVSLAKESDLAIVVVGLNGDWESEGFDRKDMDLPGSMNALCHAVLGANENTVIVNQTGTPVTMPWLDRTPAVLQAFYGGNELGNGLADVLFGKVNPSGKLAMTFPKRLQDCNTYESFGATTPTPGKVMYTEGIYVGYRHFDHADVQPLYPFGHGLSYTTFSYFSLTFSRISASSELTVQLQVKNTGVVSGQEVVQVYVADVAPALPKAPKELKGFATVELLPGETKTVTVQLGRDAFRHWEERQNCWVADKGRYRVLAGASSSDIRLEVSVDVQEPLRWTGL
ncbi:glycoside hydrolase family 3 protein [Calocera cornea HHB12733]|uniref:beta-glucosidase n=1 Tax=Calocera cornea HHB12733 TaxID=1353952 RepID=A0A165DIS6_9BASI|nr:glycoside hydrolase family 3 protein [Calocera cornea HHB12733]